MDYNRLIYDILKRVSDKLASKENVNHVIINRHKVLT